MCEETLTKRLCMSQVEGIRGRENQIWKEGIDALNMQEDLKCLQDRTNWGDLVCRADTGLMKQLMKTMERSLGLGFG